MFEALREFTQSVLGRGEATITVPSFDGALKPNQALEQAQTLFEAAAPEDLASNREALYLADGHRLQRIEGGAPVPVREFDRPITALTFLPGRRLAVALGGREVRVYGDVEAAQPDVVFQGEGLRSVNALSPAGADALYASEGSAGHDADQ
jgi:hypothetical protein